MALVICQHGVAKAKGELGRHVERVQGVIRGLVHMENLHNRTQIWRVTFRVVEVAFVIQGGGIIAHDREIREIDGVRVSSALGIAVASMTIGWQNLGSAETTAHVYDT